MFFHMRVFWFGTEAPTRPRQGAGLLVSLVTYAGHTSPMRTPSLSDAVEPMT